MRQYEYIAEHGDTDQILSAFEALITQLAAVTAERDAVRRAYSSLHSSFQIFTAELGALRERVEKLEKVKSMAECILETNLARPDLIKALAACEEKEPTNG